ncbi:MAG: polysaccharide deacetylase family protein [Dethiobacter sp.]|jgi:polysaccharide deacetylase family sporulation protein PdaB|nr:polysaccharide deacetylase family protein [Dethiobacter sp.]MBS3900670.1 polysaccharide deacetylase family protein [Dethiobacter sp.]MBS3989608.1 polysaccharide deacetylase family protein [Dethiobacter sp.]
MLRERRVKKRKLRFLLFLVVAFLLLLLILHRQIIQGVFSPTTKGVYYHIETEEKAVTFTFDVVWEPGETGRILEILDRYNIRATFFLTGTWVRYNPDLAREILLRGHEIGHHGYSHKRLTEQEDKGLAAEFALMEETLREELQVRTVLFRPPYGEVDQRLFNFASEQGYTTVLWSIDPHDWLNPGVDKIISRVLKNAHNGAIILFHTNATQAVEALPVIIQSLKMKGYQIIPFTQLMATGKG